MAKLSYDMLQDSKPTFSNKPRVTFFNLKDDGDEAIVRFLYDDVSEFEILSVHQIQLGSRFRKVNCIRDPKAPLEDCPLCKDEFQLQRRIYVRVLQYVTDESGNIVVLPKIWERAGGFANQLKALMDEYGPLSECLFKVKRSGSHGSRETTYSTFYCNPKVYKDELYPKHPEYFNNYKVVGGVVLDKTFNELEEFLDTGEFPESTPKQVTKTVAQTITSQSNVLGRDPEQLMPWEEPKTIVDVSKLERGGTLNSTWVKYKDDTVEDERPQKVYYNPQPVTDKWEENLTTNPTTVSRPEDAKVSYGPAVVERQVRGEQSQPQQQSYRPVRRNYY